MGMGDGEEEKDVFQLFGEILNVHTTYIYLFLLSNSSTRIYQ